MADRLTSNVARRQALKGAGVLGGLAAASWLGWTVFTDDEPSRPTRGSGGAARAGAEPDLDALADSAVSGGPGKDGIPSIDKPVFVPAADASFLSDDEPVFGLLRGGEVRAYPQQVLVWHEIVNDTYGQRLRTFPLVWTSWRAWRAAHPDTRVLSTDTGALRSYGDDPYGSYVDNSGYYAGGGPIFDVRYTDDRLPPKDVVIGVRAGDRQVAIHKELVRRDRTVRTTFGASQVRAEWDTDLDTARVEVSGGDQHTVMDAMWFAWYAFYPNTEVVA